MRFFEKFTGHLHFDNIDVLRVILALGIVWHHMEPPDFIFGVPVNIPGRVLVWFFYLLSGYVISRGFYDGRYFFSKESVIRFYKNRILRLIPLLYCVYISIWFLGNRDAPLWAISHLRDLFFFQYYFQFNYIGAAWFLGPLVYMYLLSPLLFWIIMKFKFRDYPFQFLIGASFLVLVLKYISVGINVLLGGEGGSIFVSFDDRTVLGNLGVFVFGATIWPLFKRYEGDLRKSGKVFCAFSGVAGILGVSVLYEVSNKWFWIFPTVNVVALASIAVILVCLAFPVIPGGNFRTAFKVLSLLSYGLFLWHGYIVELCRLNFPDFNAGYGSFILFFMGVSIFSLGLSFLSYLVVETNWWKGCFGKIRKLIWAS